MPTVDKPIATMLPKTRGAGFLPDFRGGGEPVVLKPQSGRLTTLLGVTFFAAFWNGIVSVFVIHAVGDWRSGSPEWFLMVFLIPFVLIGAGFIFGIFYYLLALFNPRVTITVSSDAVALGGPLDVAWEMTGRVGVIRRLTVALVGAEEATYTRGTDTTTDKKDFITLPIADTTQTLDMIGGAGSAEIPAETMHSFEAPRNKIVWTVRVHGEIPWWPDVREQYKIVVLPIEMAGGAAR